MKKRLMLISAVGLGAGLMYMFDPARGRRRRALLRDKAKHMMNETSRAVERTSYDLRNRLRGTIAETATLFRCEQVSDEVLMERVRSRMGRAVARPKDIEVNVMSGCVTLRGMVRENEVGRLLKYVSGVHGVTEVESQLKIKKRPSAVEKKHRAPAAPVAHEAAA